MTKSICILGSTGSIGVQTIDVATKLGIKVVGLSAYKNVALLIEQARELDPDILCIGDEKYYTLLKENFPDKIVVTGQEGLISVATYPAADLIVNALVGISGLVPTVEAILAGKRVALANKETLVTGGKIIKRILSQKQAKDSIPVLIPVDSEHSAIFQCLVGEDKKNIKKIILTASGGPFRGKKLKDLQSVNVEDVLKHPTWNMGRKITVDSATLINKGFEVIEAMFFFDKKCDDIDVVIHPQSIIHSMVEFIDGSVKAQLSYPDMRLPIEYALTFPERGKAVAAPLDLVRVKNLTFEEPDFDTFFLLKIAYECAKKGESYPIVLNAANEEAVKYFLEGKIGFVDIMKYVAKNIESHRGQKVESIQDVLEIDTETRQKFKNLVEGEKS
ncbi:1-deoxy-D-xylulose 5-phosphate reductoisomerase [Caldicellulosiruptor kronotskyensis 2002]|uniref:1-deoxy-D-xylulose 5-phosphate reductoisomerase n=1 Tax=Caldicellulosiruptor kronotskyensis (strain DSM 18902 / VKM B-2412 / 2002) TaxID=632348 RepID=E4SDG6_CALK2|nr:1-deoxy-D-xylulose-5-phosphate reductoisomerase [Caldicellulosiruptor kronotskyensis]ADQ45775.1 1-deoxy-D-xylulose 5-phosphate reductoisomerase [Caldicellulosiruptor kronotskyensis 2002]